MKNRNRGQPAIVAVLVVAGGAASLGLFLLLLSAFVLDVGGWGYTIRRWHPLMQAILVYIAVPLSLIAAISSPVAINGMWRNMRWSAKNRSVRTRGQVARKQLVRFGVGYHYNHIEVQGRKFELSDAVFEWVGSDDEVLVTHHPETDVVWRIDKVSR